MLMVGIDASVVEAELVGGLLGCSGCGGVLGPPPWGYRPLAGIAPSW